MQVRIGVSGWASGRSGILVSGPRGRHLVEMLLRRSANSTKRPGFGLRQIGSSSRKLPRKGTDFKAAWPRINYFERWSVLIRCRGDNLHPVGAMIATAAASAEVITEAFEGSLAQITRGQALTDCPSNDVFR
jgi:hypothetical protein